MPYDISMIIFVLFCLCVHVCVWLFSSLFFRCSLSSRAIQRNRREKQNRNQLLNKIQFVRHNLTYKYLENIIIININSLRSLSFHQTSYLRQHCCCCFCYCLFIDFLFFFFHFLFKMKENFI